MGSTVLVLVEMRAGLLLLKGGQLNADTRRGLLQVVKYAGDDQVHLVWQERLPASSDTASSQLDWPIVNPDQASFKQIPGKRAYVFQNPPPPGSAAPNTGVQGLFFWSQESDSSEDASRAEAVNALLREWTGGAGLHEPSGPAQMQQLRSEVKAEESRPMDPKGAQPNESPGADCPEPAGSAAAVQTASSAPTAGDSRDRGAGAIQASDLAAILSNIGVPAPAGPDPRLLAALLAGAAGGQQGAEPEGPSLNEVLRSELLLPLLRGPDALPRLAPYLPEEHRTQEALEALVVSAQFRAQLDVFGTALQSGQLELAQFGLQAEGYSVAAFLESIQQQVDKEQRKGGADA